MLYETKIEKLNTALIHTEGKDDDDDGSQIQNTEIQGKKEEIKSGMKHDAELEIKMNITQTHTHVTSSLHSLVKALHEREKTSLSVSKICSNSSSSSSSSKC